MATIEISEAIIEVMKEVHIVWKNMTVWSGSNSYEWVADKDVKQAIRASMIKNWLSLLPTGIESKIQIDRWEEVDSYSKETPKAMKTKQSVFTEVDTRYILLHTSGESIELAGYGQGVDTQDKWAGKATTYALKNTLLNMFLIPTGVDTDNTHSDDHEVPKAPIKSTPTGWYAEKKWLNFRDLKQAIEWGTDTEALLAQWILDNGYTLSWDMKTCLRTYCNTEELIQPEYKK
jgi:hypothetical protein